MSLFACVDYRKLNQMTINDAYPLPLIEEIFTSLRDAYCFLPLDLLRGYHQILGARRIARKIAFLTHKGHYVFKVMPYGLGHAPATFQRIMEGIFRDQIGKDFAAYLDDLLMYALRHGEMLHLLDRTLGQLIDSGLNCKPRKGHVFPDSIQYL